MRRPEKTKLDNERFPNAARVPPHVVTLIEEWIDNLRGLLKPEHDAALRIEPGVVSTKEYIMVCALVGKKPVYVCYKPSLDSAWISFIDPSYDNPVCWIRMLDTYNSLPGAVMALFGKEGWTK
jgi:hypothetical protein